MIQITRPKDGRCRMPPQNPPPMPPLLATQPPDSRQKLALFGVAAILIVAVVFAYFQVSGRLMRGEPQTGVEEVYALVRDKVSKSAAVPVNLPEGVSLTVDDAEANISCDPPVAGTWAAGQSASVLLFQPSKELRQGTHYTVSLKTPEGTLSKDFYVDEDPRILSIFPRAGSEAPEYSEITVVFNRPMVPLMALSELDKKEIPVEIQPATKGKWKWTTTRNLQFIPETRLQRSATYTVTVKDGLISADGLPVVGAKHSFTTRPLRYEGTLGGNFSSTGAYGKQLPLGAYDTTYAESGQRLNHEPMLLHFNQPVDLQRTKAAISVRTSSNVPVPVVIEYGTRTMTDEKGKAEEYIDKSVLAVYGAYDRFGREKLWDFNTTYVLSIREAIPAEGDIVLREPRNPSWTVPDVIAEVTATSPRTRHAS